MRDNLQLSHNAAAAKLFVEEVKMKIMFPSTSKVTKAMISDMVKRFQSAVHGEQLYPLFQAMLNELETSSVKEETADAIFWLLTEALLRIFLKEVTTNYMDISSETIGDSMTETELQTLRYVAGYIVRKLKTHANGELAAAIERLVEFSNDDGAEHNTFLDYTKRLLDLHDRGGLIKVNDKFFVLLLGFEKLIKPFLFEGTSEPVKKMTSALNDSLQMSVLWDQVVDQELDEREKSDIYNKLIDYYVTLRIKAFANAHKYLLDKTQTAVQRNSLRHRHI